MKKIIVGSLLTVGSCMAIEVGVIPPSVTLSGVNGGKVGGGSWSSSMLKGKVHILFYVDPDERDLNKALTQALKQRHFNRKKYASVAMINLAATWLPNVILESKLKAKQKEFPDTIYVKDKKKVVLKKWDLADDNSDILIFDKKGRLIYKKYGKLSDKEIGNVLALIEKNL
ncbi:transcriptional regulator [Sulfurovum lithotrophicum]|uniref:Transcriptional regulator n=1 Tax=Sulfurovum lithotrophicum TaxID=206403 RepID=A0A7U4RQ76_9BACT|nr:YtfJ family protein [Sulfurovum lithotrophicum]AKF24540.1 transcriptional regulator [Sulfurovum lithotrophicum]